MKLNGPNRTPKPSQMSRKEPSSAKVRKEVSDGAPFDPLESAFQQLADLDRKATRGEPRRIRANLKGGFEALVDFKTSEDKSIVVSVKNEKEIPLYASLLSGAEKDSQLGQLHEKLKRSEGTRYYLQRSGEYLRTDAAGATVALDRGSEVVVRRADGKFEPHRNAEKALSFAAKADPKGATVQREMERAGRSGLVLTLHEEETEQSTEPKSKLQRVLEAFSQMNNGQSQLEMESGLADAILKGSKVNVGFEGDERPIALPLTLSREEMNLAAAWSDSPPDEVKSFKDDFKNLVEEKKTVFMTQQPSGPLKGMVVRADDRATFFQLHQGNRTVALDEKGDLHELKSLNDFKKFKETGRVSAPAEAFDGSKTDSDNLMMFYHVSPFDPIEKGNYDDLPQRITSIGSSPQLDIVTMRSDLPTKRNLRVDRVQKGELQELKRLDAETAMSEPKVLEDFVYETVKANMGDGRIRFLVGGHGGAEKGLLPDGEHNNSAADQAMAVDNFAGAISKALDRVEKETGQRPKIDNLMLVSCLMGNTSFIHALAQTGDIETLVASPELMAGSNPLATFDYLADPKTSKATGREYAQHLVDTWSQAPAMIDGDLSQRHADTIGAYDLSPQKAKRFQKALGGFFDAALAEPKYAAYLKESIARAPSYGINPLINVMFDVDNRDLLQVLDQASTDARISSPKLKQAMKELKEATEAQVIDQKVSENYQGRRGPSLYLPLDKWDFNQKMSETNLLKSTNYKEFMDMIFDAPLHRGVAETLLNEASRLSETGALDKAFEKLQDMAKGAADQGGPKADSAREEADRLEALHNLEEKQKKPGLLGKAIGFLKGTVKVAAGVAAGALGGVVAAGLGAVAGSATGAVAGWRGVSAAGTHKPAGKEEIEVLSKVVDELLEANGLANDKSEEADTPPADKAGQETGTPPAGKFVEKEATQPTVEPEKSEPRSDARVKELQLKDTDLSPLRGLLKGRVAKGLRQLFLSPAEGTAIKVHESAGRKWGEFPGRVMGALTGAVAGGLFTALAAGGVVFAGAGLLTGAKADRALSLLERSEIKGESTFIGRYGEENNAKKE